MTAADRTVRCRYLNRTGDPCTGEAVDAHGEVLLCTKHLALAIELVRSKQFAALTGPRSAR
jgi:hypothetical protein